MTFVNQFNLFILVIPFSLAQKGTHIIMQNNASAIEMFYLFCYLEIGSLQ